MCTHLVTLQVSREGELTPKQRHLYGGLQGEERETGILCIWHRREQRAGREDVCTGAQRGMHRANLYRHKEDSPQWTERSALLSDIAAGSLWEHAGEQAAASLEHQLPFPPQAATLCRWSAGTSNTGGEDGSSIGQKAKRGDTSSPTPSKTASRTQAVLAIHKSLEELRTSEQSTRTCLSAGFRGLKGKGWKPASYKLQCPTVMVFPSIKAYGHSNNSGQISASTRKSNRRELQRQEKSSWGRSARQGIKNCTCTLTKRTHTQSKGCNYIQLSEAFQNSSRIN